MSTLEDAQARGRANLEQFGLVADADIEDLPPFPEPRTDRQVFNSIENLLLDLLDVNRKILERLGTSADARSSVEVKTSTRGVDIASKSYDGSDVEAQVGPAVAAYFNAIDQVQARLGIAA